MSRVLVVCSVHNRMSVSPAELLWLLGQLRPDVLFLEHPSEDVASFRDGTCGSLESVAVMQYLRDRDATLVPVDLDSSSYELPAHELRAKFDEMFRRADEASPRLRVLEVIHTEETEAGGFAYLNSALGRRREVELRRELRNAVNATGEPRILAAYDLFERMNNRRELAMLAGIEEYARRASFKQGVLLVGSAHRQQLIEKLRKPTFPNLRNLEWQFEWEINEPASFREQFGE